MATQKAFASYQEIIDLHTEADRVTVLGIHTPQGDTPRKMFGGFFDQFKKYKYLGANLTLVPAARLPVDPLGISYGAGEPTIDPRDLLNPILWHGCHGNDLGAILNKLYGKPDFGNASDSLDVLEGEEITQVPSIIGSLQQLYYQALTDNTWRKAHPQKGFRKSGLRPLVYSLASTRQIAPGVRNGVSFEDVSELGDPFTLPADTNVGTITRDTPQFITPRLTSLGWLDTRNVMVGYDQVSIEDPIESSEPGDPSYITQQAMAWQNDVELPKIFMGVILLPPAYKTEQYFRMIVTHHFAFRGFRGLSMDNSQAGLGELPSNVVNANLGFENNESSSEWEPSSPGSQITYRPVNLNLRNSTDAAVSLYRIVVLVNGSTYYSTTSARTINAGSTSAILINSVLPVGAVLQVKIIESVETSSTAVDAVPASGIVVESGSDTQAIEFSYTGGA